jgi:hypothetical protein
LLASHAAPPGSDEADPPAAAPAAPGEPTLAWPPVDPAEPLVGVVGGLLSSAQEAKATAKRQLARPNLPSVMRMVGE